MAKTRDGIKLGKVVGALEKIAGMVIRAGTNHAYVAKMKGYQGRSCPIDTSTDARRMIVPWIIRATDYTNAKEIYAGLRRGAL
jgi:hypothetical protein